MRSSISAVSGAAPSPVDGLPVEGPERHDLGIVRSRVERPSFRVAVEVDDITRMARRQHAGAELPGEVVEPPDMPVGIRDAKRLVGHPFRDVVGDRAPVMRDADEKRRRARREVVNFAFGHLSDAGPRAVPRRSLEHNAEPWNARRVLCSARGPGRASWRASGRTAASGTGSGSAPTWRRWCRAASPTARSATPPSRSRAGASRGSAGPRTFRAIPGHSPARCTTPAGAGSRPA